MIKVSFDFDGTLSEEEVQEFASYLVNSGFNVFIITSRIRTDMALSKGWHWIERQNNDLLEIADKCNIPRENIVFTEMVDKIEYIEDKEFIFHLDDSDEEIELINISDDECLGIDVKKPNWKELCKRKLGLS